MAAGREAIPSIEHVFGLVVLELSHAVRAAAIAERHERLLVDESDPRPTGPNRARHERMAQLHRRTQQRHLAAARVHFAYAGRLARLLGSTDRVESRAAFLRAVAGTLGASGVGVTLLDSQRSEAVRASSDPAAAMAMDVEYTLGEGPGRDAAERGCLVIADRDEIMARWPRYGSAISELDINTVASSPLQHGDRRFGAVTAFDPAAAAPLVDVAGVLLAPEHNMGLGPLVEADVQAVVHQAAGMVAAQFDCAVNDALALIRAHAFATNQPSDVVAEQIVTRRLRLS